MMWNYGGDPWTWMWMMGGGALVFIAFIFLVAWAVRSSGAAPKRDDSMDLLRSRLAKGEITPDDFEKTRKALGA